LSSEKRSTYHLGDTTDRTSSCPFPREVLVGSRGARRVAPHTNSPWAVGCVNAFPHVKKKKKKTSPLRRISGSIQRGKNTSQARSIAQAHPEQQQVQPAMRPVPPSASCPRTPGFATHSRPKTITTAIDVEWGTFEGKAADAAHYRSLRFEIRLSTACGVAAFATQLVALLPCDR
jgi:hypothetical protein